MSKLNKVFLGLTIALLVCTVIELLYIFSYKPSRTLTAPLTGQKIPSSSTTSAPLPVVHTDSTGKAVQVCTTAVQAKDPLISNQLINGVAMTLGQLDKRYQQTAFLTLVTDGTAANLNTDPKTGYVTIDIDAKDGTKIESAAISVPPSSTFSVIKVVNGKNTVGDYKDIKNGDKIIYKKIIDLQTQDVSFEVYYYR